MSNVLCGILLILYVSFTSVVCYIVGIEFFLFFCYRQQEEKGRRRVEGSEPPGKFFFQQLSISVLQYPLGMVCY